VGTGFSQKRFDNKQLEQDAASELAHLALEHRAIQVASDFGSKKGLAQIASALLAYHCQQAEDLHVVIATIIVGHRLSSQNVRE
jgi:hypothetical protein